MIQWMLIIWSLVPLPFLNPAVTSGSSRFTYYWNLAWGPDLASLWNECNCRVVWTFFVIDLLWDQNENWPFPVLWPLLNFPQFIVIHTVKGFGIVNKAEINVFLEFSCLFWWCNRCWQFDLVPLPFLKPAWTYGSSRFMYCWSLAWRNLSITLLDRKSVV